MTVYGGVWVGLAAFSAVLGLWLGVPFWLTAGAFGCAVVPAVVGMILRRWKPDDSVTDIEIVLWAALATLGAASTGGVTSMLISLYVLPLGAAWLAGRPRLVVETACLCVLGYAMAGFAGSGHEWLATPDREAISAGYSLAALAMVGVMAAMSSRLRLPAVAVSQKTAAETDPKLAAALAACETRVKAAAARALEAEQALENRTRFFAQTSHEMGNALNPIRGFSEMMAGEIFGPLSPKYKEYADLILQGAGDLSLVVQDVMDISRIEAGKYEIQPEPLSLTEYAEEAIRYLAETAERKSIRLELETEDDVEAFADSKAVKQIALNLINNALKFTPSGGEVTVTTIASVGGALLAVSDTGAGISEDELRRLSRAFEQGDEGRKHAGTGLGLSVVRAFAELHGGRLDIESRPGGGTTIGVFFPAEPGPRV